MGDNRIRIAVFLLSFEELFNNLFDRRVICSVKIRFWLFLIFLLQSRWYTRFAIFGIFGRDRDLLDRPGQVGLGKRGKGERGSKTREKKERVRVTLEPRYCGRADSSLVDWFSPHSSSYHDSTRENFLSRRMRRNDAENRSQCPFSPLQPFGFLFFFLFPPPPTRLFSNWSTIRGSIFRRALISFVEYGLLFVRSRKSDCKKQDRHQSFSKSFSELFSRPVGSNGKKGKKGREKQMAPRFIDSFE